MAGVASGTPLLIARTLKMYCARGSPLRVKGEVQGCVRPLKVHSNVAFGSSL